MRQHSVIPTVLAVVACVSTSALGSVEIVEAHREVVTWAYGFGYDFNDGVLEEDSTAETSGPFAAELMVDLEDYYNFPVAHGEVAIDSELSSQLMLIELSTGGLVEDAQVFQADGGGEATVFVEVDLSAPMRVTLGGSANGAGYTIAYAYFRRQGDSAMAQLSVQGDDSDVVQFDAVLAPGRYKLDVSLMSWAYGGADEDAAAEGDLVLEVRFFDPADLDQSGSVDVNDLITLLSSWGDCDDCPADLDGNGVIDVTDLLQMLAAWGQCDSDQT